MVIAQLAVLAMMVRGQHKVSDQGTIYNFELQGIDPHDPFRGKYLILMPKENTFKKIEQSTATRTMLSSSQWYATFDTDHQDLAKIKDLSTTLPADEAYLEVQGHQSFQKDSSFIFYTIRYPFDRYYMNEAKALPAEHMLRDVNRDSSKIAYAKVAIYQGKAAVLDVMVDGRPIESVSESATGTQ